MKKTIFAAALLAFSVGSFARSPQMLALTQSDQNAAVHQESHQSARLERRDAVQRAQAEQRVDRRDAATERVERRQARLAEKRKA